MTFFCFHPSCRRVYTSVNWGLALGLCACAAVTRPLMDAKLRSVLAVLSAYRALLPALAGPFRAVTRSSVASSPYEPLNSRGES